MKGPITSPKAFKASEGVDTTAKTGRLSSGEIGRTWRRTAGHEKIRKEKFS
jgi:hypothetical protein